MDNYTATEQAYKNGYEQGQRDAVKHGRWENLSTNLHGFPTGVCTNCGERRIRDKHCPNCGARMDGGADNENG